MEENKELFVSMINDALVACGNGRYDSLKDQPLKYVCETNEKGWENEYIIRDNCKFNREAYAVNVCMDSLQAIMADLARSNILSGRFPDAE